MNLVQALFYVGSIVGMLLTGIGLAVKCGPWLRSRRWYVEVVGLPLGVVLGLVCIVWHVVTFPHITETCMDTATRNGTAVVEKIKKIDWWGWWPDRSR